MAPTLPYLGQYPRDTRQVKYLKVDDKLMCVGLNENESVAIKRHMNVRESMLLGMDFEISDA